MRKIVFIFIFLANAIYGQQTKIDTLKKITVNNNQVFKLKKLIIPTVLIGYGVIGIESDGLKFINSGIKEEVNENIDQKITIDDFSQYAPAITVYGLNVVGIKGKHNFKERTIILGTSYLIMSASVLSLKSITKVERPDRSAFNSFPSGHTATAFAGAEFLWQEGHTAHATKDEAEAEARQMLEVYADFAEKYMAMPVVKGVKSASERFAGALDTYTIEGLMQDGKALQSGTSHFLGQNFAKAFDVKYIDKTGKSEYVWATSWGVSTRLMGALIMSHSDDNGLVLPPKLAPIQVVIVPIYKNDEQLKLIDEKISGIVAGLKSLGISVKYDNADNKKPGWKFAEYELKGVPVRLAMGGRDLENNTIEVMRRDKLEKETVSCEGIEAYVKNLLDDIQENIFKKAFDYRTANTVSVDSYDEFKQKIEDGGFILAHWDGTAETEELIKNETKATIRCIPLEGDKTPGVCMVTGKPTAQRVVFARAY